MTPSQAIRAARRRTTRHWLLTLLECEQRDGWTTVTPEVTDDAWRRQLELLAADPEPLHRHRP